MSIYTVKAGDTLTRIAYRHGVTVDQIAKVNRITNPDKIKVGQVLEIPKAQTTGSADAETGQTLAEAIRACISAIEDLPEYQALERMLGGMEV